MANIIPLISSGTAGPLGVLHLPRLWQKVSLKGRGKLADDYPDIGDGFDSMVISGLGLTKESVRQFITSQKPTYPEFEEWIKQQPGATFDSESIEKLNAAISGYEHEDGTRQKILKECGLPDDGSVSPTAIALNNLDDWNAFHREELK